jgi:hypothetical protein
VEYEMGLELPMAPENWVSVSVSVSVFPTRKFWVSVSGCLTPKCVCQCNVQFSCHLKFGYQGQCRCQCQCHDTCFGNFF